MAKTTQQGIIMIRLSKEHKKRLQKEAKAAKKTLSGLVRERALSCVSLQAIENRLKKIESRLSKR